MLANELREKYLSFFKLKDHVIIQSASLIPENDPSVLFTTAGMHPLVPFLLGEKHPAGKRITSCQKCIRTGDIADVGDLMHGTFFEMLGNWSLGDYFKKESIALSYEFLTSSNWLDIDINRISITVFAGDADAPRDETSANLWKKLGIPENRIYYYPKKDNWWGPPGETGPCGPDTEIFFDAGLPECSSECRPGCSCGKYFEIWNNVFMEYKKTSTGKYEPLLQKNVDTGMGVERTIAMLQGKRSIYDTELFLPVIGKISELSNKSYSDYIKPMRIVADHLKAATFIMGDPLGVAPSNLDQGYVLRRLIRISVRQARNLNLCHDNLISISRTIAGIYGDVYPELMNNWNFIEKNLTEESIQFELTLEKGLKEFEKIISNPESICDGILSGQLVFKLHDTFGFPPELTTELAAEKGIKTDIEGYREAFRKHQEISRSGSDIRFKGGLADCEENTIKLHTVTHLLHKALRIVLGNHVMQKGSNITPQRLRFDFSHPDKLTDDQIRKVEEIINKQIERNMDIEISEMTVEEAKNKGAIGLFEGKYGEKVKVYKIGDFSIEICGGPHVMNTGKLGKFKIIKEESSSKGVRRIKAILE
ncbi:MAG: alanine--tRNA ligase [Candidatus Coatesbacteria bacterium]|nr:alanine--tRNA ligase [Candidatus Coatesbacteria bacterium]